MIVDTSVLYAFFVGTEPAHDAVTELVHREAGVGNELVVSPFVIAELDYLVTNRFGVTAERAALDELSNGAWAIPRVSPEDLHSIADVVTRYSDPRIGATDASLVVLADRYATKTIATLDRRHFEVLRGLDGAPFDIRP